MRKLGKLLIKVEEPFSSHLGSATLWWPSLSIIFGHHQQPHFLCDNRKFEFFGAVLTYCTFSVQNKDRGWMVHHDLPIVAISYP